MKLQIFTIIVFSFSILYANEQISFEKGKDIYEKTCISCHGVDGTTNDEMRLIVKPRRLSQTILTEEQSFQIIKEGAHYWGAHADIMPAFKYVLNDVELKSVALYITQEFNSKREERMRELLQGTHKFDENPEKMLKVGKKIFKRNCSLCHGITGNGQSEYVELSKQEERFIYPYNLQRTLLNEEQIFLYSKYGGHYWGTYKTDMPSWKRKYDDYKLRSVAKYVYEKIKQVEK